MSKVAPKTEGATGAASGSAGSSAPASTTANSTVRVAPIIAPVSSAVAMPERSSLNKGSKSLYPFASLVAVGQSFGVKNKTAKQLASIVSNANKNAADHATKHPVQKKDANGQPIPKTTPVTDPSGIVTQVPTGEFENEDAREYFVVDTDPKTDPDGATSRVFRNK